MKVRGSLAQEGTDSKGDTGIERCRQEQKEVHSKRVTTTGRYRQRKVYIARGLLASGLPL